MDQDARLQGKQGMLLVSLLDMVTGKPLVVATAHLKAKAGTQNEEARTVQAAEVVALVASIALVASLPTSMNANCPQ